MDFWNELEERKTNYGIGLDELIMRVTGDIGIDMEDLLSSKREQKISYARGIINKAPTLLWCIMGTI